MAKRASVMSQIEAAAFEFASCGILSSARSLLFASLAALRDAKSKGLMGRVDRADLLDR